MPIERWHLYSVGKAKNEIDGLIAHKTAQLNERNAAALSFDGHDPFTRSVNDYLQRLDQFGDALEQGRQLWENAYNAAHEASLLKPSSMRSTKNPTRWPASMPLRFSAWLSGKNSVNLWNSVAEQGGWVGY